MDAAPVLVTPASLGPTIWRSGHARVMPEFVNIPRTVCGLTLGIQTASVITLIPRLKEMAQPGRSVFDVCLMLDLGLAADTCRERVHRWPGYILALHDARKPRDT